MTKLAEPYAVVSLVFHHDTVGGDIVMLPQYLALGWTFVLSFSVGEADVVCLRRKRSLWERVTQKDVHPPLPQGEAIRMRG